MYIYDIVIYVVDQTSRETRTFFGTRFQDIKHIFRDRFH